MRRYLLIIVIFVGFLGSCVSNLDRGFILDSAYLSGPEVCAWPNATGYEIFPQSFADTNNDGIGDLHGIIQKLDYLQDLGIKAIWLMPIMPSPSYHKYDVTDYKNIHPDYGTIETCKELVKEAHSRDIKIIIDFVINHTSRKNPWFIESQKGEGNPFRNYYIWANDLEIDSISSLDKAITGDSDNITQWHAINGSDKKYYGFFSDHMPDLNYDNPAVREEVKKLGAFWLNEIGVDGFRLDAAKHIYEDHRVQDNIAWWKDFKQSMRAIKPDVYIIGEVWDNADFLAPFSEGMPAMFNFDLSFSILESIKKEKNVSAFIEGASWEIDDEKTLTQGYLENMAKYTRVGNDYQDAIFLTNHDQNRILSMLGDDPNKGTLAASILLSLPGTPFIYYGEEIGMLGQKPDPSIREPFLWTKLENDEYRANWEVVKYSTDSAVTPLSEQRVNPHSIFNQYKNIISIRNRSYALSYGDLKEFAVKDKRIIAFTRKHEQEEMLVLHNVSGESVEVNAGTDFNKIIFSNRIETKKDGDKVSLAPYASVFILKQN